MKVTLLGTGTSQGVPVIACDCIVCLSEDFRDKRLRSSIMIEIGETNIVIDSGPDFRQQMLNHSVKKIDAILFTHEHKDHVAGLDDVRAFNNSSNKETQVYANQRVKEALHREFHYVFSENKYPGIPRININEIKNEKFYINDIEIIPIEVLHHKLPVFGFRINKFVYITDVSFISEKEKEKIFGAEVLVIDSLRKKKHPSHFNLEQSLNLITEINPNKSFLTHISHYMGKHADVNNELPENISLGFDGQIINL